MKIEWRSCFKVGISIFILYLCIHYWSQAAAILGAVFSAAMPLLLGCVIAYIVNILMSFYEKNYFRRTKNIKLKNSRRPVCLIAAFITLIVIVVLIVSLVVPEFVACVRLLIDKVPGALMKLENWLVKFEFVSADAINLLETFDFQSKAQQIINTVTSGIGSMMGTIVGTVASVFSGVVTGLLAIIFSIYVLLGKEKLAKQINKVMKRYMKENWLVKTKYVWKVMDDCFHKYIVGQCLEAVILGLLCTIGMLILRLPYATMIGALIGLTALIPVAGAYIGAGVGAFMIFTVTPFKAVIFLIFIVVLQQLEGNIIYPRVVGSSMGLPAIWVLSAVTIGGGVMGIGGMLLGVPLAATMYRLVRDAVNKK